MVIKIIATDDEEYFYNSLDGSFMGFDIWKLAKWWVVGARYYKEYFPEGMRFFEECYGGYASEEQALMVLKSLKDFIADAEFAECLGQKQYPPPWGAGDFTLLLEFKMPKSIEEIKQNELQVL